MKILAPGVFVCDRLPTTLSVHDIDWLVEAARATPLQRARICIHQDPQATVHEMLIAVTAHSYIRPHRHINKGESFLVLRGEADVVLFHDDGSIKATIALAPPGNGSAFYLKLEQDDFHTLALRTSDLVFMETTRGPFDRQSTQMAPFSPPEDAPEQAQTYMNELQAQLRVRRFALEKKSDTLTNK